MSTNNYQSEMEVLTTKILIDRKERLVAELLTRFKNLVTLACSPREGGAGKEVAAAQAFHMEVESTALVWENRVFSLVVSRIRATEDLHRLVRQLKEMWLFGPLKGVGEGEDEGKIDEDSVRVGELLESLIPKLKTSHF
ncbi:hypothetical protein GcM1_232069 [Golovinomyces cichoracearum]|uniref:Uncharacterized protein n=1 Tax=Golovinomyces cichoracearum TaxID=62708 RepID=A0A420IMH2_9PEZI|nr:hypothetical protein GcM1_232069 [Golovinomyces cichoracearum]